MRISFFRSLILLAAICSCVGELRLEAQVTPPPTQATPPNKELNPKSEVEFHTEKNGWILSMSLPGNMKTMYDAIITVRLINLTGSTQTFSVITPSYGFDYHLADISDHEMTSKPFLNTLRQRGLSDWPEILKPNGVFGSAQRLEDIYDISVPGKYKLTVKWNEIKDRSDGWRPGLRPDLSVTGSFSIQNTPNGISITKAD